MEGDDALGERMSGGAVVLAFGLMGMVPPCTGLQKMEENEWRETGGKKKRLHARGPVSVSRSLGGLYPFHACIYLGWSF
jgi:hypothetical protein